MSSTQKRRHPLFDITTEVSNRATCTHHSPGSYDDLETDAFKTLLNAARQDVALSPQQFDLLLLATNLSRQRRQSSSSKKAEYRPDVTAYSIHKYLGLDVGRNAVPKWEEDYEKIKFEVQNGRGSKCRLSSGEDDVVHSDANEALSQWQQLMHGDGDGNSVNGQQQDSNIAKDTDFVLASSCSSESRRVDRNPVCSASWRVGNRPEKLGITYCKLHNQTAATTTAAGASVDTSNSEFKARMEKLRKVCGEYDLDDIYSCNETGMYLMGLDDYSELTTPDLKSTVKTNRGWTRVSILLCINASGTSLTESKRNTALRPLVVIKHLPKDCSNLPLDLMTVANQSSGCMDRAMFLKWLRTFDNELTRPSLLILDSCSIFTGVEGGDPESGKPWRHLRIEYLLPNSRAATQPLDQGVISVFKRKYMELLSDQTISKSYGTDKAINKGSTWSLIPHAWSYMDESILRHCFRTAGILPSKHLEKMARMDNIPPDDEVSREPWWPPMRQGDEPFAAGQYVRLFATPISDGKFTFELDEEQRDAQEVALERVRQLRLKMGLKREETCTTQSRRSLLEDENKES